MPVKGVQLTMKSISAEFKNLVQEGKLREMDQLVNELKEATPVDTGEARDGWHHDGKSIRNDVEHLKYLNEGSSKQAPAHFIEQTVLAHKGVSPSGVIVVDK